MNKRAVVASVGALVGWGLVWFALGSVIGYTTDTGTSYGLKGGLAVMAIAYGAVVVVAALAAIIFAVLDWVANGGER